jgi:xanthine dehydrogenase YagS FAD-binding subunit
VDPVLALARGTPRSRLALVALREARIVLDALIQVTGPAGARSIPIGDFHRLPGATPHVETDLRPAELITAIDLPALPWATRSHYLKVRDRGSDAFALVSVAAALDLDAGVIRQARLALGGVAPRPWRVPEAERLLVGRAPDANACATAADVLLRGATPYPDNAFKIELARRSVVPALTTAAALA